MIRKQFVCKFCGKNFEPNYKISQNRTLHFCSKQCKTKFQRQGYFNKTQLENAIKKLINSKGRYVTKDEVLDKLNISSKTLVKFHISILSLNRELGMKKPKSIFEYMVGVYLNELFNDLTYEQTFENCVSKKGYLLRFDFYSPANRLLIEADGIQHGNIEHPFSSECTIKCDEMKDKWAKENGYILVRVPYSRKVTKEYVFYHVNRAFLTTT